MTKNEVVVRPVRLPEDAHGVLAIDTSFTTDTVFRVVAEHEGFRLVRTPVAPAAVKRFTIDSLSPDELAAGRPLAREWDRAFVATQGTAVAGFIATSLRHWNRHCVIHHFYVDTPWRRSGVGRRLLAEAIAVARQAGMARLWLETSSLNVPGVDAYRRLGFELCGLDTSLYAELPTSNETALFLSRPLTT